MIRFIRGGFTSLKRSWRICVAIYCLRIPQTRSRRFTCCRFPIIRFTSSEERKYTSSCWIIVRSIGRRHSVPIISSGIYFNNVAKNVEWSLVSSYQTFLVSNYTSFQTCHTTLVFHNICFTSSQVCSGRSCVVSYSNQQFIVLPDATGRIHAASF